MHLIWQREKENGTHLGRQETSEVEQGGTQAQGNERHTHSGEHRKVRRDTGVAR